MTSERYREPGWFTRHLFNPAIAFATRSGLSVWGSRVLQVPGRSTGQMRETPVNLLVFEGQHYLVAPRGVTQWVRNLRSAGAGAAGVPPQVEARSRSVLRRGGRVLG